MYKLFISLCLIAVVSGARAQEKKVAVITFFADKRVDLNDFGLTFTADVLNLENDPNFNIAPVLNTFHQEFFEKYAKNFPFQLVPEADVLNNAEYKAYTPVDVPRVPAEKRYQAIENYQVVGYNWGKTDQVNLLKMFSQYDGIMFVYINFSLVKGFAINGNGTTKMKAYTHIVLLNKDNKVVFNLNESANSKKTGTVLANVPIMKPEKLQPMCESALTELMEDLQKRIPKLVKKVEAKL